MDDKLPCNAKNTLLLMLHVNIVSLKKNFDSLYEIISQLSNAPHIICLSESRLKTSTGITTNISLPGYKFLHYDTPANAGGSAIHVDASLRFEIIHSLNLQIEGCEDLCIKLIDYNTIIGSIYRHPKIKMLPDSRGKYITHRKRKSQSKKNDY